MHYKHKIALMDQNQTINCKGILLDLSTPKVMAIINMTPDSFYDHSRKLVGYQDHIDLAISEGCDILDIGGMSSRPGASLITIEEEWGRVQPALEYAATKYPHIPVSIDTLHSEIARRAINEGAHIVNDISGGDFDKDMIKTIAALGSPFIVMHMPGLPQSMQSQTDYDDVTLAVLTYLRNKVNRLRAQGIKDVIVDPGFGFGKTVSQNYELLQKLSVFKLTESPILVGVSRKSMINKILDIPSHEALNGTTALHMIALQNGAQILRVHDVKEAVQCIKLHKAVMESKVSH